MLHEHTNREIIELSASILTGVTETRTSELILFPFKLRGLTIYTSAPPNINFTFRLGFTRGQTDALSSDNLFEDLYSSRSSKETNRYPAELIVIHPNIEFPQAGLRFKAEGINASGVEHAFWVLAIIEEMKVEPS